jgi:hypothetical protein
MRFLSGAEVAARMRRLGRGSLFCEWCRRVREARDCGPNTKRLGEPGSRHKRHAWHSERVGTAFDLFLALVIKRFAVFAINPFGLE